jgi:trigger factor
LESSLGEAIKERGLQIVSRPQIEANDLEEGRPFSFSAIFEVKPEIEVKDYLDVAVERPRVDVTDAQVDEALRRLQESHARLEPVKDRAVVERGDFITLDFVGSVAGKPFAGGKGENYLVEVGSGRALPQFEEALVGLKCGESQVVQVNYPQEYPNRELAGQAVEFSVAVREIKQKVLPPVDDDFAKDCSERASLEELRADVRDRLEKELKQFQDEELKEQIVDRLIEAHPFTPPPSMVDRQVRYLMERYQNRTSSRASGESDPMRSTEESRKALEPRATRQVRATLLIERISQLEKIQVTDKEVQERIDHLARAAGDRAKTVREIYSRPDAREDLRAQLVFDRTLGFLLERAQVKEVEAALHKVAPSGEKS